MDIKKWNSQNKYEFEFNDIHLKDISVFRLLRSNSELREDLKKLSKKERFFLTRNIFLELELKLANVRADLYRANIKNLTCLIPKSSYKVEYQPQNRINNRIVVFSNELNKFKNRLNKIAIDKK
jgi:hypothetical protein